MSDNFNFDMDAMELGIALGFGEEMAQSEIEQQIEQANSEREEKNEDKEELLPIQERKHSRGLNKPNRYYDPFLHYAFEVAEGIRDPDDYTGVFFNHKELLELGPDENGDFPWQTSK